MVAITGRTIGENLRSYRRETGLTQAEFGRRIGRTPSHVSKLERGARILSAPLMKKICIEFDVRPQRICYGKYADGFRKARVTRGLTINQLAERSKVSAREIKAFESGARRMRVDKLERICRALNCKPSTILGV